jgi:hypothetical protein
MANTFSHPQTIKKFVTNNSIPDNLTENTDWLNNFVPKRLERDGKFDICKVPVNPLLLFLHLDQGSFANAGYTPFASPVANSRSIHEKHVDKVCQELLQGNNVINREDIAIVPYSIVLGNYLSKEKTGRRYRCTLNRDAWSDDTLVAKCLANMSFQKIDNQNEMVSYTCWFFVAPPF